MAAPSLLLDFAIVFIAAEIGSTLFHFLRLPRVVGMLAAGIELSPFTPGIVVEPAAIQRSTHRGASPPPEIAHATTLPPNAQR